MASSAKAVRRALREFAFGFPDAWEDHPWGESVAKVGKKVFTFFSTEEHSAGGLAMSVKLPVSGDEALELPFVEPTGYGLGKSGWVTVTFPKGERLPVDLLRAWITESYRAVAPAKLVAKLDAGGQEKAKKGTANANAPAKKRRAKAKAKA